MRRLLIVLVVGTSSGWHSHPYAAPRLGQNLGPERKETEYKQFVLRKVLSSQFQTATAASGGTTESSSGGESSPSDDGGDPRDRRGRDGSCSELPLSSTDEQEIPDHRHHSSRCLDAGSSWCSPEKSEDEQAEGNFRTALNNGKQEGQLPAGSSSAAAARKGCQREEDFWLHLLRAQIETAEKDFCRRDESCADARRKEITAPSASYSGTLKTSLMSPFVFGSSGPSPAVSSGETMTPRSWSDDWSPLSEGDVDAGATFALAPLPGAPSAEPSNQTTTSSARSTPLEAFLAPLILDEVRASVLKYVPKYLTSFGNAGLRGELLLGVADDGDVTGIPDFRGELDADVVTRFVAEALRDRVVVGLDDEGKEAEAGGRQRQLSEEEVAGLLGSNHISVSVEDLEPDMSVLRKKSEDRFAEAVRQHSAKNENARWTDADECAGTGAGSGAIITRAACSTSGWRASRNQLEGKSDGVEDHDHLVLGDAPAARAVDPFLQFVLCKHERSWAQYDRELAEHERARKDYREQEKKKSSAGRFRAYLEETLGRWKQEAPMQPTVPDSKASNPEDDQNPALRVGRKAPVDAILTTTSQEEVEDDPRLITHLLALWQPFFDPLEKLTVAKTKLEKRIREHGSWTPTSSSTSDMDINPTWRMLLDCLNRCLNRFRAEVGLGGGAPWRLRRPDADLQRAVALLSDLRYVLSATHQHQGRSLYKLLRIGFDFSAGTKAGGEGDVQLGYYNYNQNAIVMNGAAKPLFRRRAVDERGSPTSVLHDGRCRGLRTPPHFVLNDRDGS